MPIPTVNATVYWDSHKKKPKVDPDPIQVPSTNGQTAIVWTAGEGITSFEIRDLSTSEFSNASNQNPTTFSAIDNNDRPGTYSYKVKATHSSGVTAEHDPKIENGSG